MLQEDDRYKEGFMKAINEEYVEATKIFYEIRKEDTLYTNVDTYLKVIEDAQNQKIQKLTANYLFQAFIFGRSSSDSSKINYLQMAIQNNPDYAISYKELGNVLFYKKEYNDAILIYKKALVLDSTYFDLYYNLAISYDESGQKKNALLNYKKYVFYYSFSNDRYVQYSKFRIMNLESFSF
jgi:tetratricopeptide (TPR) repeat protein